MAGGGGTFAYASSDVHNKHDCLGRIPYASLIALALSLTGVTVFCTLSYRAVNTTLKQMKTFFKADAAWLDKVQLTFVLVGVVMGIVALILLVIGALSTGATRTKVYSGWKARLGGRISCAVFLVLTYVLYLCWLGLFTLTTAITCLYWLFIRVCDSTQLRQSSFGSGGGTAQTQTPSSGTCVNFGLLAYVINSGFTTTTNGAGQQQHDQQQDSYKLCGEELSNFCLFSDQASAGYYVSYFACAIVLLGLIHYMICLAANYVHIKDGFKYFELEEIRMNEENEMNHYGTRGTGNFRM